MQSRQQALRAYCSNIYTVVPCTFDFRNLGLENRNALVPIADNYTLELSKHWTFICLLYAHLSILHTAKVINVTMPPLMHRVSFFKFSVRFSNKLNFGTIFSKMTIKLCLTILTIIISSLKFITKLEWKFTQTYIVQCSVPVLYACSG